MRPSRKKPPSITHPFTTKIKDWGLWVGAGALVAMVFVVVIWHLLAWRMQPVVADTSDSGIAMIYNPVRGPSCAEHPDTFDIASGDKKEINPYGCQLRWKIRSGCVKAIGSDGQVLYPKACAGGDEAKVPNGIYSVIAVGGPAKVRRTECDPRASGISLDSCT